jgi:hypothetical protein
LVCPHELALEKREAGVGLLFHGGSERSNLISQHNWAW